MAKAERIPNEAMAAVAGQISDRIAGVAGSLLNETESTGVFGIEAADSPLSSAQPVQRKIDLGETFAVWMLGADQISSGAQSGEDLVKLATDTGYWHHQIRFEGKGRAYARSKSGGDNESYDSWKLCELGVSTHAEEIHAAAEWSDIHVLADHVMRLLLVPSRLVRAFWFIDEAKQESTVYIINAPSYFENVTENSSMSSSDFLAALADESEISGYH